MLKMEPVVQLLSVELLPAPLLCFGTASLQIQLLSNSRLPRWQCRLNSEYRNSRGAAFSWDSLSLSAMEWQLLVRGNNQQEVLEITFLTKKTNKLTDNESEKTEIHLFGSNKESQSELVKAPNTQVRYKGWNAVNLEPNFNKPCSCVCTSFCHPQKMEDNLPLLPTVCLLGCAHRELPLGFKFHLTQQQHLDTVHTYGCIVITH